MDKMSDEKFLSLFFKWWFSDNKKMTEQEFIDMENVFKKYNLTIDDLDIDESIVSQYNAFKKRHTKNRTVEDKHTKNRTVEDKHTKNNTIKNHEMDNSNSDNTIIYIIIWILIIISITTYILMH